MFILIYIALFLIYLLVLPRYQLPPQILNLELVTVDGVRRAQCKLCPNVSYAFLKNTRTGRLRKHIKSKHSEHQPRQTQISTLGGTLGTFTYNRDIGKTNLAKYLSRSDSPKEECKKECNLSLYPCFLCYPPR